MANVSRFHAKVGTLRMEYASGEGFTFRPTEGNITITNMNADNFEDIQVRNRGEHDGHVEGPDLVQDVSFTLEMPREDFTSALIGTISDFFLKTGTFVAAASVDPVIKGSWILIASWSAGAKSGEITLPEVTGTHDVSEGAETNTIAFSGRNFKPPVWANV